MKIAYVTALFPYAPQEQFFEPELRSLCEHADVLVVPLRPPSRRNYYPGEPWRVLNLPLLSARVLWLAACEALRAPLRTASALRAVFLEKSSWRSRAVNAVVIPKALAVARLLREERVDHVHAAWLTTPATLALVVERLTGIPFSISAHAHDVFAENLVAAKIGAARFVRAISEEKCRRLRESLPRDIARRCVVVHLGVAPLAAATPAAREVPRLVSIARLHHLKGHRYLIDALEILRRRGVAFACDFIGDGELRAEVETRIERAGLGDCVRLLGNVPHAEVVRALESGEYDLSLLASVSEGIPVAAMESMAAGIPMVATDVGGVRELVKPGSGALVPERNPLALARAIERYLRDPDARRQAGAASRAAVLASFETGATTRRLFALMAGSQAHPRGAGATAPAESIGTGVPAMGPWTQPQVH